MITSVITHYRRLWHDEDWLIKKKTSITAASSTPRGPVTHVLQSLFLLLQIVGCLLQVGLSLGQLVLELLHLLLQSLYLLLGLVGCPSTNSSRTSASQCPRLCVIRAKEEKEKNNEISIL